MASNHTEDEKEKLKKIYRVLAIHFHPDRNKDDDGEMMKFVNKLKEEWGI
jgi:DnaJ-class molecular chaperone